ncbi:hypothetical protein BDY19DRAFT_926687 [Irpex rosettiformis]|uniref:Uncharacterized protein n=1 Tax=Irpex rosettiformis TaxID=378272 RepID=A0ACB8UEU9_9APHY|nr:hypothetical protein BDY19DRAFT_926687 [Irpex rosettiformis]
MASPSHEQGTSFLGTRQRSSTPLVSGSPGPGQPVGNASPASSATASTTGNNLNLNFSLRALDRGPFLRLGHSTNSMNFSPPIRKPVIRSDPSIITCFDPADKELYDLWAPKR